MDSAETTARWEPGPVVAWTESDGPGRLPPVAPRRLGLAAAVAAGVATWGMLTSDQVCPEHSLLIDLVASLAMVLTIVGVVAALKSSVAAAPLILTASVFGVAIGAVDAMHDPTRSRIVAIAFGVGAVISAFSAVSAVRVVRWERSVVADAERPIDPALFRHPASPAPRTEAASAAEPQASEQH